MIPMTTWLPALLAGLLALLLGWLAGRRTAREETLLTEERHQALQDRFDELQDEKMLGQQTRQQDRQPGRHRDHRRLR